MYNGRIFLWPWRHERSKSFIEIKKAANKPSLGSPHVQNIHRQIDTLETSKAELLDYSKSDRIGERKHRRCQRQKQRAARTCDLIDHGCHVGLCAPPPFGGRTSGTMFLPHPSRLGSPCPAPAHPCSPYSPKYKHQVRKSSDGPVHSTNAVSMFITTKVLVKKPSPCLPEAQAHICSILH